MGWATGYIENLQAGKTVKFRPRGSSMSGKIESGQLCTVEPAKIEAIEVGDIVLCKVKGREYLHLVQGIRGEGGQHGCHFLIGNNRGGVNGWVGPNAIYGRCIQVGP